MIFEDAEVDGLDLSRMKDVSRLVVEELCGEKSLGLLSEYDITLLTNLIDSAKSHGMSYEQFNELLLLLNQDRVEKAFFDFFFETDSVSLEELKKGIIKFRGYALLCFGNFRFAFNELSTTNEIDKIKEKLEPYCVNQDSIEEKFKKRPDKMLKLETIQRDETWLLGEISGGKADKESKALKQAMNNETASKQELEFAEDLKELLNSGVNVQQKALRNTDVYLTWDYMDVYIATSMRNRWEYEETFDFINHVFENAGIETLSHVRFFDPTQSKCSNPRDKGLIEGLMLKRAALTVYMVQEGDTMGKDSELASTLAQRKPVIAYVPKYETPEELNQYAKKIAGYPLDFFKKRLLILDTEGIFDDEAFILKLGETYQGYEEAISNFLRLLDDYRKEQPYTLWVGKEDEFKKENDELFKVICGILAKSEAHNFERRASLLMGRHPLAMQVDLQTGISNGVLVVRSPRNCAILINGILTNSLSFVISREDGFTVLKEKMSGSAFRVITNNERLTNSFWNFFR